MPQRASLGNIVCNDDLNELERRGACVQSVLLLTHTCMEL